MLAMCSMIALFGAIYLFVGYLNSGTDLPPSDVPVQGVPLSAVGGTAEPLVQGKDAPTAAPVPSATRIPQTSISPSQPAPAATATSVPSTATPAPTITPTLEPTPTTRPTATPTPSPTPTAEATPTQAAQVVASPAISYAPTTPPTAPASTPAPTVAATPTPTAGPTAQLIQRVADAEKGVRSGRIEAEFGTGKEIDSTSKITFDFGDASHPPRIHFESTYSGSAGTRTTELIIIGDRYWERTDGGPWSEVGAREGVWGQVQSYMPGVPAIADVSRIRVFDHQLIWTDEARDVDVTLEVDLETGIPRQLRRDSRSTDTSVTVTYSDWNAPVDVQAPPAP